MKVQTGAAAAAAGAAAAAPAAASVAEKFLNPHPLLQTLKYKLQEIQAT